ncbi:MAG: hypothetical protein Q4C53_02415 [Clostridia bacterium]|nr:hypothetical protein [Clostridia bacterium]
MNLGAMWKAKKSWDTVNRNHPKLAPFLEGIRAHGACEGMEIAVAVRYPDGTEYKTGIRLQQSDIEALAALKDLKD